MMLRLLSIIFFSFLLSACTSVPKEIYREARIVPQGTHTPPISFSSLKIRLPRGEEIGRMAHYDYGCLLPAVPVGSEITRDVVDNIRIKDVFENALEPMGYDVVASPGAFDFEEEYEDEMLRTEYKVSARLIGLEMDSCYEEPGLKIFTYERGGFRGQMFATYEWSVFDNIRKTTVYKTRTSGYVDRKEVNPHGLALMIEDTFEMAAHNLGADVTFYNLMVRGTQPAKTWTKSHKDFNDRPRRFNAAEPVILAPLTQGKIPLGSLDTLKQNALLIQGGAGHGSGFFITKDGHILTNEHVVGNARRVRIVTSGKAEKLVAEVLRVNKTRDIALLRLENIPEGLNIYLRPLRTDWPLVGSDVYVIGAPLTTRLQDTVTKGIISAHRPNFKMFGVTQDILQADVAVQGGNSGGPMLDAQGNIIGVSVAGTGINNEALNYFIPIESALRALDISY